MRSLRWGGEALQETCDDPLVNDSEPATDLSPYRVRPSRRFPPVGCQPKAASIDRGATCGSQLLGHCSSVQKAGDHFVKVTAWGDCCGRYAHIFSFRAGNGRRTNRSARGNSFCAITHACVIYARMRHEPACSAALPLQLAPATQAQRSWLCVVPVPHSLERRCTRPSSRCTATWPA